MGIILDNIKIEANQNAKARLAAVQSIKKFAMCM